MIQFDSQFADGLETTNYFLTKSLVVEMLKIIDNLGILECIKLRSTISSSGHGWNTINSFNDKSKTRSSPVPILQPIYPLGWKAILIWICHGHQEAFIFEIRYHWNPWRGFASHDVFQMYQPCRELTYPLTVPSTFEWMASPERPSPSSGWDMSLTPGPSKQRSACLRMQRTYPEARNFTWQFAVLLVKVDGDRHSQVWWRFVGGLW